jgi:hypothetical protein
MPTIAAAPWEKITAVMLAVLLIAVVLVFSMLFPQPTDAQYATYKTILALAAGGFGSIIPGLIHVDLPLPKGVIRAAGAVVLFVVVFFFTPAPPASAKATTTGDVQQTVATDGTGVIHTGEGDVHVGK